MKLELSIGEGKAEIIDLDDKCRKICEVDSFSVYEVKYIVKAVNEYETLKQENEKLKEDIKKVEKSHDIWFDKYHKLQQQLDKAIEMLDTNISDGIYDEIFDFITSVKNKSISTRG